MGDITKTGLLFAEPYNKPLSTAGQFQPGCYLLFTSGGVLVPVYRDPQLLWPYNQTSIPGSGPPSRYAAQTGVVADATGRFSPIYLDPAISYSYSLYSAAGVLLETATNITSSDTTQTLEATKPFITSLGSGTTPIIDPALQIGITAPGFYRIEANLSLSAVTNLGLDIGLYYSGTVASGTLAYYGAMNSVPVEGITAPNFPLFFSTVSNDALQNFLNFAGTIQVSTTGTFSIKWSNENAGVSVLSMSAGSALYAQKIG